MLATLRIPKDPQEWCSDISLVVYGPQRAAFSGAASVKCVLKSPDATLAQVSVTSSGRNKLLHKNPVGCCWGETILHWIWIFSLLLSPSFVAMFSFPGGQGNGLGWEELKKSWVLISPARWTQVVSMCESISQAFFGTDKHHQHFFNPRIETFSLHNVMDQSQSSADLWWS